MYFALQQREQRAQISANTIAENAIAIMKKIGLLKDAVPVYDVPDLDETE